MTAVHVLYGTETYNSLSLAERTAEAIQSLGITVELWDMEDVALHQFPQLDVVLIVTSTFGDGDPPSNAESLHQYLMSDPAPDLTGMKFSVCALGDRDYEHFCQCGRDFDRRMVELNAQRIADRADCDVDFEDPWSDWLDRVMASFQNPEFFDQSHPISSRSASDSSRVDSHDHSEPSDEIGLESIRMVTGAHRLAGPVGTRKNPAIAQVLENINLNHPQSDKETRHIALAIDPAYIDYRVGDVLGVFPRNCPDLVRRILQAVDIPRQSPVLFDNEWFAIRDVLIYRRDVMTIDRRLLTVAAASSKSVEFEQLLSDSTALKHYCDTHHVIDVVEKMDSTLEPADFIACLRPLAPRLYSIASSPKAYPGEVHLTVNVLRYTLHGTLRKGVSSTFLGERAGPGVEVGVYVQKTKHFVLCDDHVPIIMIGPGTGIAPFRAFLQERAARGAPGQSWLFFGSQHESMDFLYREDLESFLADGYLARLDNAWSRDQSHKVYVQDLLYAHGGAVYRWLEAGAVVYVCGDASRMAKDVEKTLLRIIQEFGRRSHDAATVYLSTLAKAGRYLKDVY